MLVSNAIRRDMKLTVHTKSTSYINLSRSLKLLLLDSSNLPIRTSTATTVRHLNPKKWTGLLARVTYPSPLYIVAKCEVVILRYVQVGSDFCRF